METSSLSPEAAELSRHPQGRVAVGHPVDVASGVYFCAWHDVEVAGYAPLVLRRYYSTGLLGQALAHLGPGWTHNFAMSLTPTDAGYVLRDQNGGEIEFSNPDQVERSILLNLAASMELRLQGANASIYHWHDWKTAVEVLRFERDGGSYWLRRIGPPSGYGLTLEYDSEGRLATVSQVIERRRLHFDYDTDGRLGALQLQVADGGTRTITTYEYDAAGYLVAVHDALDAPHRYRYDQQGRMIEELPRSGAVFSMKYDLAGRCVMTRGRDGHHACKLHYALDGKLTLVTNSLGAVTAYELNGSGQVVRERRPNGAVFETRYDEWGRIVEEEAPYGAVTRYRYDAASNTQEVTYPSGERLTASYDADHQPLTMTQGERQWRFTYARGLLLSIVDPRGAERHYRYDPRGFVNLLTEPTGNTMRIDADAQWTRGVFTDNFGLEHEEFYNDLMHVTRRVEPNGGVFEFDFDPLGRLTRARGPGMRARTYRYDAGSYLSAATDTGGFTTLLEHDVYGRLKSVRTPTGRLSQFTWDTEGRLLRWTNPVGEVAELEHDGCGNETLTRHFDGRIEEATFDLLGRPLTRRLPDGTQLDFGHDIANNLVRIGCGDTDLIVNEFDSQGFLLSTRTPTSEVLFEYTAAGQLAAETQNGRRVDYAYDASGLIVSRQIAGSMLPPLAFEWDARARLTAVRRGTHLVQAMTYDALDRCVSRRFGASVETSTYSSSGRLAAQVIEANGRTTLARSWLLDDRDNVIRIDDSTDGVRHYQYDPDHRLVLAGSESRERRYGYDDAGNLVRGTSGDGSWTRDFLPGNRLLRSGERVYHRDANARVIRIDDVNGSFHFVWNALGQLVEAQAPGRPKIQFDYDGLGRRLRRIQGEVSTEFLWAGEQLIAEIGEHGWTEFMFDGFSPTAVWRNEALAHCSNSPLSVPHEVIDDLGTVRWSQRLDEWGKVERSSGATEWDLAWRFAGQYAEPELGLHYNRFRYYDATVGQYLSPDPLGLGAGANEFVYTPNPVNWIDPWGLTCGIPPGQHTVYVLEKGTRGSPGPPPVKPTPPTPPQVIYVGITMQSPHDRLSQHYANPPGGVRPDGMRIIASGPSGTPPVTSRVDARLIEASILTNGPQPGTPGAYNNAPRPVNPGYYHSNIPSAAPPGTTYLPPSTTNGLIAPTNGTVIT